MVGSVVVASQGLINPNVSSDFAKKRSTKKKEIIYLCIISFEALNTTLSTSADKFRNIIWTLVQLYSSKPSSFSHDLLTKSIIFTGVPHRSELALNGHMVIEGYFTFSTGYAIVSITVTAGLSCHAINDQLKGEDIFFLLRKST